ncbi:hypothetical protein ACVIGB_002529 [Bradyrhizobium sp. USDA 4341]
MTVVVTVKINDGIVLAADSAVSFFDPATGNPLKIYSNANKVFNLVKGLPIGVMFWGVGGIGSASVATLAKDLRRRLAGEDKNHTDWKLPDNYTMEFVAQQFRKFFFEERFITEYGTAAPKDYFLGCKICGYSTDAELPEVWDVKIIGDKCAEPERTQTKESFGPRWDGEYEALDRLILGIGTGTREFLKKEGLSEADAFAATTKMVNALSVPVVMAAMPIQDAIDLATFMVETTIKFVRFNFRAETVGGAIEIAAITKHEGFKWVKRKFFYTEEVNP